MASSVERRSMKKTLSAAGIERLLGSLEHIRRKMGSEREDDFKFLSGMLQSNEFQNLVEVHNRVTTSESTITEEPLAENTEELLEEVTAALSSSGLDAESKELLNILEKPNFRQLYGAHGRVARREFPRPPSALEPEEEEVDLGEKLVKIHKKRGQTLGATIRINDKTKDVFVSRVLHGSLAHGKLRSGDLLLEMNGQILKGKTVDEVAELLGKTGSRVTFKISRSEFDANPTSAVYVKAYFAYDPLSDTLNPCQEAGLKFEKAAILKIVNQDDPKWWQAVLVDQEGRAGLIPSKQLQERRMSLFIGNDIPVKRYKPRASWWKLCVNGRRRKSFYSLTDECASEIMTYEEVAEFRPDSEICRPVILIGPAGVGRATIKDYLTQKIGDQFASPIPTTSRPKKSQEIDGQDYHFNSKGRMEDGMFNNQFVEYGEHKGHYYGTSIASVKDIMKTGKVCVLPVHPRTLRKLKRSDIKPFVVFIKPPPFERLRETRRSSGSDTRSDDDFWKMLQSSKQISDCYGYYFDVVIVNDDVKKACHQLRRHIEQITTQSQWIPKQWLQ